MNEITLGELTAAAREGIISWEEYNDMIKFWLLKQEVKK